VEPFDIRKAILAMPMFATKPTVTTLGKIAACRIGAEHAQLR